LSICLCRFCWRRERFGAAAIIRRGSEHLVEGVAVEQVPEFQVFAEHVERLVPAEALEFGRVFAAVHPGGERAAFQAVAAKIPPAEPGCRGAGLDDGGDRPGRDRLRPDPGQGLTRRRLFWAARCVGTPGRR
jgi:hypothetical protein